MLPLGMAIGKEVGREVEHLDGDDKGELRFLPPLAGTYVWYTEQPAHVVVPLAAVYLAPAGPNTISADP